MKSNRNIRIHAMSMYLGGLFAVTGFALLGAAPKETDLSRAIILPRFLVLAVTPVQSPSNPQHPLLQLRLSRHYGKIDQNRVRFSIEHETQELTLLIPMNKATNEIQRGDIISFEGFKHLKLQPGSRTIRHLPSGGTELVP
jgi:hypothetical protein